MYPVQDSSEDDSDDEILERFIDIQSGEKIEGTSGHDPLVQVSDVSKLDSDIEQKSSIITDRGSQSEFATDTDFDSTSLSFAKESSSDTMSLQTIKPGSSEQLVVPSMASTGTTSSGLGEDLPELRMGVCIYILCLTV